MSMNATTVKMPSTANESAARAVSPPKAAQQAQTPPPPSTSSQKSLAGMRAPQPRQTPDHNAEKAEYARAEREAQQP